MPFARLPFAILFAAAAAHADPATYVDTGAMIGIAQPVAGPNLMSVVEVGRAVTGPIWLHAAGAYGLAADDQGPGRNSQLRAGADARACVVHGALCAALGLDVGVEHGTWTSSDRTEWETVNSLVAIPRFGIDTGGTRARVRLGFEIDYAVLERHDGNDEESQIMSSPGFLGTELTGAFEYRW